MYLLRSKTLYLQCHHSAVIWWDIHRASLKYMSLSSLTGQFLRVHCKWITPYWSAIMCPFVSQHIFLCRGNNMLFWGLLWYSWIWFCCLSWGKPLLHMMTCVLFFLRTGMTVITKTLSRPISRIFWNCYWTQINSLPPLTLPTTAWCHRKLSTLWASFLKGVWTKTGLYTHCTSWRSGSHCMHRVVTQRSPEPFLSPSWSPGWGLAWQRIHLEHHPASSLGRNLHGLSKVEFDVIFISDHQSLSTEKQNLSAFFSFLQKRLHLL